jgi:hypothetical protein
MHVPRCSTHTHHAHPRPTTVPQALLGAENVTDVAFDTPGLPHAWCAEETRALYRLY